MSMGALIEKFRAVGLERIERMNALLVALERHPHDAEGVDELMREIHTLKGEAKMMGFADINLVAHQTENLLLAVTNKTGLTDAGPMDLIFEGLDVMRALLTKNTGNATANIDLNGFIDRVAAFGRDEKNASAADDLADAIEKIEADEPAEEVAVLEEARPEVAGPEKEKAEDEKEEEVALATKSEAEAGRSTRTRIKAPIREEQETGEFAAGSLRIQASSSLRVEVEKLERIGEIAGETLLMSRRLGYRLGDLQDVRHQMKELFQRIEGNLPKSHTLALRNLAHRIDACEAALREENHLVNMRASQLDDQARHLRHIPLAQVLSHYPRAVRDLANGQGKKVRLVHTFGNVDVDRTILSALSEPLLHLVRNAVDHGIESPEERERLGKDPEGEISLFADYAGDSIRVVLADDGNGIDPEVIRQKAIEREFMPVDQAKRLSDQEAIALIFEPGFTTRQTASDISGRGIGMDVVRRQITRIGGFIEIESEVGQGTTFTLHLPVSTAINAILVFALSDHHFALTAKDVERVAMVSRDQLETVHGGVCLQLDGHLVPLVDWTGLLGLKDRGQPPDNLTVLLVRKGTRRIALWVDDVIGEREAINRPLGEFLSGINLCRGVALTDSGAVVPLLNAIALIEQSTGEARVDFNKSDRQRSFTAIQGRQAIRIRTILVVEDSEVTRSLVVSILKNQGFRVVEADDGNHGWSLLQRHRVDLVLSDIQMPGMDGLELLQKIRNSEDYAQLPVVILTTLGAPKDKQKAMSLGANGYLVKLSFQEQDLIDTVRRYLG